MIEGLWSVYFSSQGQVVDYRGAGVIVCETQRILGGDSEFFYLGDYEITNGTVRAKVKVTHYFGQGFSIFGPASQYTVVFEGVLAAREFVANGYVVEDPSKKVLVKLTKRAELP